MSGNSEIATPGRLDGLKWGLVAVLVAVGVYGNYYFSAESLLLRVVGLLVIAAVAGFVALQTVKGGAFWTLLKDAKTEIRKVVWPTRQETVQTTLVVVAVVLVMGLILWGLDSLLGWMISSLI
ncbi:preprotein translocase subunit SecE [Endozoicomonas sp. GU-1]|uniref:preprotein translocase subunit SecE n=1 Tax=Endozoicomonas sp. GU-1 TaxID=3009078 RepID=UPI0022B32989|nr:preprotein translocase subunit SecE [Endozoicomonas sp. GU-1]WBA82193.1 preprotein translocase subunit SecE [Endozoicomonas sp. GU-1]WBA85133.1 preprotein translocase subunit SecE [Endozoicomonas sp. GU-1]